MARVGRDGRRRRARRAIVGSVATLVLVLVTAPASDGPSPSGPVTPAAADESTASGTITGGDVVLLGDSVTEQAFGYLDGATRGAPSHLHRFSHYGWTLPQAAESAGSAVDAASTAVLVIAAGPNDAASWDGGWTTDDVQRWRDILDAVPDSTCVAVVLPGWGGRVEGTQWAQDMEQMRTDVTELLATRRAAGRPTVTVDWLPIVQEHPDYLAADGIHLATDAAATARQSLYWQAVADCRGLSAAQ